MHACIMIIAVWTRYYLRLLLSEENISKMNYLEQAFILALAVCASAGRVRYVKPDASSLLSCPGQPCFTLDQYTQQRAFTTGATFVFLSGNHAPQNPIVLRNSYNITFVGKDTVSSATITCKHRVSITCENVSDLTITRLIFLLHPSNSSGNSSSVLKIVYSLRIALSYLTFKGSGAFAGPFARALYSVHSSITVNSSLFQGNTGYFGGAIVVLMSNLTLANNIFTQNRADTNEVPFTLNLGV